MSQSRRVAVPLRCLVCWHRLAQQRGPKHWWHLVTGWEHPTHDHKTGTWTQDNSRYLECRVLNALEPVETSLPKACSIVGWCFNVGWFESIFSDQSGPSLMHHNAATFASHFCKDYVHLCRPCRLEWQLWQVYRPLWTSSLSRCAGRCCGRHWCTLCGRQWSEGKNRIGPSFRGLTRAMKPRFGAICHCMSLCFLRQEVKLFEPERVPKNT